VITKEPVNTEAYTLNRFFTKSARSAFLHILRKERDAGRTLLLPAYIGLNAYEGSGVFDVIQISRIPYTFYAVDQTLAPVLASLPQKNDTSYLFLLIHYFGFAPHNFEEVLDYCKSNKHCLVEDCAHTLSSAYKDKALGTFGSYAFHSIHKVLPTSDGGLLVDNSGKRNFQIDALEEGIKATTIAQFANSDLDALAEKRIQNFERWRQHLHDCSGLDFMFTNPLNGIVPLNFPVLVKNDRREALYFFLMENEAPSCALYYKMIPQISEELFPLSYEISTSILNLPTHQDTSFDDIDRMAALIKSFFKS
jgi:dTDP-4-amino-4,6-dideoxygalactose transaminase